MIQGKYGFRDQREQQFPLMVCLEITNVCNLRCIHCPYSEISKREGYIPEFMEWLEAKKVIDDIAVFPDTIVRFVCDGEPMMHPDFMQIAEYAKKSGIESIGVTTNGMFLNEDKAKKLVKLNCDIIEVSIDALHKSTYEKIRRGGDFDLVIKNTSKLIELRDILNKKVKIIVSIIDQPDVSHEIEEFKKYWQGKADKVLIRKLTSIGGLVDNISGENKKTSAVSRWPCPLLWRRMFINVGGLAEFCVDDWLDESVVGDARKESLREIWNCQAYQQLRHAHLKKEFSLNKKCEFCVDWPARTWECDYLSALESLGIKKYE